MKQRSGGESERPLRTERHAGNGQRTYEISRGQALRGFFHILLGPHTRKEIREQGIRQYWA